MRTDRNDGQETTPLVSITLPAYNHATYVVEALDSVRAQSLSRWELFVIDDGSTDDTLSVLEEYVRRHDDPRIHLYSQSNSGSHATLNRGMAMGRAPYLAILNSDDRYAPDRLLRLVNFAQAMHSDAFLVTGLRLIDQHGLPLPEGHWWMSMYADILQKWRVARSEGGDSHLMALLWGNFAISTSNFFMSRSIWERMGPFKPLRYVLDWDYALRVAAEAPQAFQFLDDQPLWDYRLHGENTILGGALRNHAEAYHTLRGFQKRLATRGSQIPVHGIDRLHFLTRFIRHEHTRQQLEEQKIGWVEQVQALRSMLDQTQEAVQKSHQDAIHWQREMQVHQHDAVQWRSRAAELEQAASRWQEQASEYERTAEEWKVQAVEWRSLATQMQSSRSWRATAPLRGLLRRSRGFRNAARALARKLIGRPRLRVGLPENISAYGQWLQTEASWLDDLKQESVRLMAELREQPLISIVMPVHDTPPAFLRAAVDSVQRQWYANWELCICDDASQRADTRAVLKSLPNLDPRIRCVRRDTPGHIVQATNAAIALAKGEYLVFLDHDDQLATHALMRLAQAINDVSSPDLIYSDEDKLSEAGHRCLPLFKPQWSPALEWSQNYVGHVMCIRRACLEHVGGLLEGSQGSQDHDLVLRLAAAGATVRHIPEVLYHWRMHETSTASRADSKPYAHQAGKEAVERHLRSRYGKQFDRVDDSDYTFVYQPRFRIPSDTKASIIIPTLDKSDLLEACIQSIHRRTAGISYEILVLDNGSVEPQTMECFERLRQDNRVRVIEANIPFNWSRLNNMGRQHISGEILVFLNNDTEVISPDWLQRLAEYAFLPDVATVGPLLLYPDKTIQHAGVIVGMGGWADHVFKSEPLQHYPTPFVSSAVARNVLANTGACLAISTQRFDELGGFDESFEICGSDVEIGIRAHKRGYQNVYLPSVQLYHFESKTRSAIVPEVDFQQSAMKYAPYRLNGDPFYNSNLDLSSASPRPKFPVNLLAQVPEAGS